MSESPPDGPELSTAAGGRRGPTAWTRPLQLACAGFFAASAVQVVLTNALFETVPSIERVLRAQSPGLGDDQLRAAASLGYEAGWATAVIEALVLLALAVASLRGIRVAFWLAMAALALVSVGVLTNSLALANPAVQTQPPAAIAVGLLLSLAGLVLLAWSVVAALRSRASAARGG
jgi:hypothetical protein